MLSADPLCEKKSAGLPTIKTTLINKDLQKVQEAIDRGELPEIAVIARLVRCKIFRQTCPDYAQRSGFSRGGIQTMEKGGAPDLTVGPHVRYWLSQQVDEQSEAEGLQAAAERVLDLQVADETMRTVAFLRRYVLKYGKQFYTATKSSRGKLNERRARCVIPSANELLRCALKLGEIHSDRDGREIYDDPVRIRIREAWQHDMTRKRQWPDLNARLLAWAGSAGLPDENEEEIANVFGITNNHARLFARGEVLPFAAAQLIVQTLLSRKAISPANAEQLLNDWKTFEQTDGIRIRSESFQGRIEALWEKHLLDKLLVADLLGIRMQKGETRRNLDAVEAATEGRFGPHAPGEAMIALAAASQDDYDQLRLAAFLYMKRNLLRKNSAQDDVALERHFYGLTYEDLSAAFSRTDIENMENNRVDDSTTMATLRESIRKQGEAKAAEVLKEWLRFFDPDTVPQATAALEHRIGIVKIASASGVGVMQFQAIHGKEQDIPALVTLRKACEAGGYPPSPRLLVDWYSRRAQRTRQEGASLLGQAFDVCIHVKHRSTKDFAEAKLEEHSYDAVVSLMNKLARKGQSQSPLLPIFLEALARTGRPKREFLELLLRENIDDPCVALEQWSRRMLEQGRLDVIHGLGELRKLVPPLPEDNGHPPPEPTYEELLQRKFAVHERRRKEEQKGDETDKNDDFPAKKKKDVRIEPEHVAAMIPGITQADLRSWEPSDPIVRLALTTGNAPLTISPAEVKKRADGIIRSMKAAATAEMRREWKYWMEFGDFYKKAVFALLAANGENEPAVTVMMEMLEKFKRIRKTRESFLRAHQEGIPEKGGTGIPSDLDDEDDLVELSEEEYALEEDLEYESEN